MASDKDTIYIDIDDEITGIIDKLKSSEGKVVAFVLPKRAAVFQSIVNMKLLKRAADNSNKHLVLITTEAGLLPLAGAAGIHVAKTLTSKPEIPAGPDVPGDDEDAVDEDTVSQPELDTAAEAATPVGQLAGARTAVKEALGPPTDSDGVETLELDDEDLAPEDAEVKPRDFTPPKTKKDKKLHVPNFERFRLWLVLGGLLLILIIAGFLFANYRLAKATINIKTDATTVDAGADINLSTTAKDFDANGNVIPAKLQTQQKTYTATVPTTGQKNTGQKASGPVTISLKDCSTDNVTIPKGTGVSANGQTYITQGDLSLSSVKVGNNCNPNSFSNFWSGSVNVTAQSGGSSFNVSGVSMTVAGYPGVSAKSGNITGGTDNIVQSVNQNDVNSAKSKITTNDSEFKQSLSNQLTGSGFFAIESTYQASPPTVTQNADVGDQATSLTLTEVITYTMFGVHKSDLETVIKTSIQGQIDTDQQSISDDGLNKATFVVDNISPTGAQISMDTKATVGPQLDIDEIKREVQGQRIGEIKSELTNNPDVTDVDVKLTPFWITTVPKDSNKITVNIDKPTGSSSH